MKKNLFYFLALPLASCLFAACGDDDDEEDKKPQVVTVELGNENLTEDGFFDGLLYYLITSDSPKQAMVKKAVEDCQTVKIPDRIKINEDIFDINAIGYGAFRNRKSLVSVEIGNSVTSIGNYAFENCNVLTNITIGNSVTSIGERAFYFCPSLTAIEIPNSVTSIGDLAFHGTGLKKIIVSDIAAWCKIFFGRGFSNPLYYAHHLYSDPNTEIKDLLIPKGVTSIGNFAFCCCAGLTSITIPNSVTSIGERAFYCCTGLESITIPNSVTSIGYFAFLSCTSIKEVHCGWDNPPSLPSVYDYFDYNTYNNCKLYIPKGTLEAYEATYPWKRFKNKVEE